MRSCSVCLDEGLLLKTPKYALVPACDFRCTQRSRCVHPNLQNVRGAPRPIHISLFLFLPYGCVSVLIVKRCLFSLVLTCTLQGYVIGKFKEMVKSSPDPSMESGTQGSFPVVVKSDHRGGSCCLIARIHYNTFLFLNNVLTFDIPGES